MYLSSVWIPAEDPVVFSTTQQELRVSLAPGYGQNSPGKKTKTTECTYSIFDRMTKKNRNEQETLTVKNLTLCGSPELSGVTWQNGGPTFG